MSYICCHRLSIIESNDDGSFSAIKIQIKDEKNVVWKNMISNMKLYLAFNVISHMKEKRKWKIHY
jgi:hypothetical protein